MMATNADNSIINLSKKELSHIEVQTLKLGLSFCPSKGFDFVQTRIDLFLFVRKLKLQRIYKSKITNNQARNWICGSGCEMGGDELTASDLETLTTLAILNEELPEDWREYTNTKELTHLNIAQRG